MGWDLGWDEGQDLSRDVVWDVVLGQDIGWETGQDLGQDVGEDMALPCNLLGALVPHLLLFLDIFISRFLRDNFFFGPLSEAIEEVFGSQEPINNPDRSKVSIMLILDQWDISSVVVIGLVYDFSV